MIWYLCGGYLVGLCIFYGFLMEAKRDEHASANITALLWPISVPVLLLFMLGAKIYQWSGCK